MKATGLHLNSLRLLSSTESIPMYTAIALRFHDRFIVRGQGSVRDHVFGTQPQATGYEISQECDNPAGKIHRTTSAHFEENCPPPSDPSATTDHHQRPSISQWPPFVDSRHHELSTRLSRSPSLGRNMERRSLESRHEQLAISRLLSIRKNRIGQLTVQQESNSSPIRKNVVHASRQNP